MHKLNLIATTLALGAGLIIGCNNADKTDKTSENKETQPAFDLTGARTAIAERNQAFMDAVSKVDSVALADCYTVDAKFMEPNAPATVGRKNIQGVLAAYFRAGMASIELKTIELWGNQDILVEDGTYLIKDKNGKEMDHGKQIEVWKMEDGKWKLFRDCFNSDVPVVSSK